MRRPDRRLLPLVLAAIGTIAALAMPAAALAALDTSYPNQSLGNRGSDVRAIQLLLTARGFAVTDDGVFAASTQAAVIAWKTAAGMAPATGVLDRASWARLVVPLGAGTSGPAVLALQVELRAKRHSSVAADGMFGVTTSAAVRSFQRHIGATATGNVNAGTWRRLVAHFERPVFDATTLCDYSVGNGPANWGTAAAIGQLTAAATAQAAGGNGRVAVGDIGFQHGGPIPGHEFHQVGLEVDIRPMRKANDQCARGVNYRSAAYDRAATRALVQAIRASAPGHVKLIYFNDPVLIKEGLTRRHSGHDDHLHVRYCERADPDPRFAC
jgi:peptidoglycan hydrolase-like protein with peptidoglycan-binding domain